MVKAGMRIKTITADNMADALRIIRDQLGPEALILGTRKVKNSSGQPTLEITAAVTDEPETPIPTPPALASVLASARPGAQAAPPPAEPPPPSLSQTLHAHGLPADLSERLLTALPALQQAGFSAAEGLEMLLTKLLPLKPLPEVLPKGRVHVFVGPTGAGKTTLIAKLAVQARQTGTTIGLMSLDDQKIAGFEPLAVTAEALGEQAFLLSTPEDLTAAAQALGPRQWVFIDTPGLSPYNRPAMVALKARLQALGMPCTVHLVVPANLHGPALALLPLAFQPLNPQSIMFTRLDETSHLGPLVATLAGHGLAGGVATNHPLVSQPALPLTGHWLAGALAAPPRQPTLELQEAFA